jgi:AbrB family looped-hinge helix DNA binding protein
MPTATVTSKGQITIPAEVRKALRLEPGTKIQFFAGENGEYIFRPRTGSIWDLRGCLAGFDVPKTDEEMNAILHQRAFDLDEATKSGRHDVSDEEVA